MMNALLHDGLAHWARETPDKPAFILDGVESLTYAQAARWSDAVSARLQAEGVRPGDNVAIIGANSLVWIICAFAILKAGAVIVPFNERFVAGELDHLVRMTTPRLILSDEARRAHFAPSPQMPPILAMEEMEALREAAAPPGWSEVRVSSDSLAQIIFTSGTTSLPKGVMISHAQLLSKYFEMRLTLPAMGSPDLSMLMCVGLQSGLGTAWGYLFTALNGGVMSFMRRFDAALALDELVRRRVTLMPGFPLLFEQISQQPGFASADLSALRIAIVGGTRVPAHVLETWRAKGVALRSMYGLTEGGNYVTVAGADEVDAGQVSCGPPVLFTRLRLLREDGGLCAMDEPGEIYVKGPGMMVGYWRNPEARAQCMVDGWLRTGDIGVVDARGRLSFVDRAKDMVITGGFNVSPSEVEAVIAMLPGVLEVGVFAIADGKFGEVPAACIRHDGSLAQQAVFEHCRTRLAGFKLPRYIILVEEALPRTANGKLDKRGLAARYADAPERLCKHLSRTELTAAGAVP